LECGGLPPLSLTRLAASRADRYCEDRATPDWPHSPVHRLGETGAYMVTAATYQQQRLLHSRRHLNLVYDALLTIAAEFSWELQAWAVMPNHYHFVALSAGEPAVLVALIRKLHSVTARALNQEDVTPGRRVWFQYWDSHITFERAYLARLNYVHHNPVHHGLVLDAERSPWCSAAWFARVADSAFYRTVSSFPIDRLSVQEVVCGGEPPL
jgi:putative transposase